MQLWYVRWPAIFYSTNFQPPRQLWVSVVNRPQERDFWCQCDRTEFRQFEKVKLEVGLELDEVKPRRSLSSLYGLLASWPNEGRTRLVKECDGDERSIGRGGTCGTIPFSGISPVARSWKEVVSLGYTLEISFLCYSSCIYWIIVHQMEQMQK